MKKYLTCEQIERGIVNTLEAGISPGFNIIWGNIGDTINTLNKGLNFILKYNDHAQMRTIRPVTAYPGTQLFEDGIKLGLVKDVEDFYENKHKNSDLLTMNFTALSDDEFHRHLYRANSILLKSYYKHKYRQSIASARKLYMEKDSTFRGFR